MSEAPQKKGTSWSIGIGLGIVALLIGTAIVTEPSVSFFLLRKQGLRARRNGDTPPAADEHSFHFRARHRERPPT